MTVPSTVSKTPTYACNGTARSFAYGFKLVSGDHLQVILEDAEGNQTTLAFGIDYTVSGVGEDAGGTFTTLLAYPTGSKLTGVRSPSFTQLIDLQNQAAFFAQVIEDALDLSAMRDQILLARIVRSLRIPDTDDQDMVLPSATLRANKYLQFDANGVPTIADAQIPERYYGSLAADPATRPDGSACQAGDIYFNTTTLGFKVYSGSSWNIGLPPASLNLVNYTEVATGGQTTFTISGGYTIGAAFPILNGVMLAGDEYTATNGTTVVLAAPCAAGDEFRLLGFSSFSVANVLTLTGNLNDVPSKPTALANLGGQPLLGYTPLNKAGDSLTGGFTATSDNDGTVSSGTYTPTPSGGNIKHISNAGAFTLAAPTLSGQYTIVIEVTNATGAGAVTFSGFAKTGGDSFTTTVGHRFQIFITKTQNGATANVLAMQ